MCRYLLLFCSDVHWYIWESIAGGASAGGRTNTLIEEQQSAFMPIGRQLASAIHAW